MLSGYFRDVKVPKTIHFQILQCFKLLPPFQIYWRMFQNDQGRLAGFVSQLYSSYLYQPAYPFTFFLNGKTPNNFQTKKVFFYLKTLLKIEKFRFWKIYEYENNLQLFCIKKGLFISQIAFDFRLLKFIVQEIWRSLS